MVVIPKTSNPDRLKTNMEIEDFTLTMEQVAELDLLEDGTHYCWNPEGVL